MRYRIVISAVLILFFLAVATIIPIIVLLRTEGQYVDLGRVSLHYRVDGMGEPVILLHGFANNSDLNWRIPGLTDILKKNFQVIALDLRGHGLSYKPHDINLYGLNMVTDVIDLLDHLHYEKAHLVGYSLGGFIALKTAAMHPDRLITVTIIGAGWESPDNYYFLNALSTLADSLEFGAPIGPLIGHLGPAREKPSLFHIWGIKLLTGYLNDKYALSSLIRSLPSITLSEAELSAISLPICAIVGTRDPFKQSAQLITDKIDDYTLVLVKDAGHISTAFREETKEALTVFLTKHSFESNVSQ